MVLRARQRAAAKPFIQAGISAYSYEDFFFIFFTMKKARKISKAIPISAKRGAAMDLQVLHRVRSRLVSRRTATINQIRDFLIEQGITVRTSAHALRNSLFAILKNRADEISPCMSAALPLHEP
jgi:ACT domain-containing protein